MPTIQEIILEKDKALSRIPKQFLTSIEIAERKIFEDILILLADFDTKGGVLIFNEANLLKIDIFASQIKEVMFQTGYQEAITEFIGGFDKGAELTGDYIKKTFGSFDEPTLAAEVLSKSKRDAIALLTGAPIDANFIAPIRELMTQSIESGSSFAETVKSLRLVVQGDDKVSGRLRRYASQIAWDNIAFTDRKYSNVIAEDLKTQYYFYSGGFVTDSRNFCKARANKHWHKKDVEKWGDPTIKPKDWDGRVSTTNSSNIFIVLGGHNCQHSLLPVSIFDVPKKKIRSDIAKGIFKPTAKERELLGI